MVTQLRGRADTVGWNKTSNSTLKFDVVDNGKTTHVNLLKDFGKIKLEDVT